MGAAFSQSFFLPKPTITEQNCPDQKGRVFIVTGGYAGIGFELCKILYEHNAIVYIAGRSESKASSAISDIKAALPNSEGGLEFLQMDLLDLSSVKSGAQNFLAQQNRLDVLVNNAGVMLQGSNEPNHNNIQNSTNILGPALLYKLLLPILTRTASSSPTASVRVLWAGSIAVHANAPQPGGMKIEASGRPKDANVVMSYGQTKTANVFLAREYRKGTSETGVVHASFNPGNLRSELSRHWKGPLIAVLRQLLFPTVFGAYTELWAAVAPEVTPDKSGAYVWPWGRFGGLPDGVEASMKGPEEGGTGMAAKFMEWVDSQIESYL